MCPRNTAGTYSLPVSNPVSGSVISSNEETSLRSDLSLEISDSLSRSGKGGMLAPVRAPDGTVTAPAHSFTNETGTGLYRIGVADLGIAVNQIKRLELTPTGVTVPDTLTVAGAGGLVVTNNATIQGTTGLTLTQGDVVLSEAATQGISKSGGALAVGTNSSNDLVLVVNGIPRASIPAATGKLTSAAATVGGDDALSLVTKGYLDGGFFPSGGGYASGNSGANIDLLGQDGTTPAPASTYSRLSARRSIVNVAGTPAVPIAIDAASGIGLPLGGGAGFSNGARCNVDAAVWGSTAIMTNMGAVGAAQAWSAATLKGRCPRVRFNQAANTDSGCYATATAWRGNVAGAGGFLWIAEWGMAGTTGTNQNIMIGLAASPATITSNPYTKTNLIAFGCRTENTLQVFSNDGSGTATISKDLGVNFPAADGAAQNTHFRTVLWAAPNASTINWAIERLDAGPYFDSGSVSVDLPANNVLLGASFGIYDASISGQLEVLGSVLYWNP